jgi:chemotaxis protein methyltransferase CheR
MPEAQAEPESTELYGAPVAQSLDLSPQEFARFAQLITQRLGIQMPAAKLTMLQGRLTRRIRQLNLSSFEQYRQYLSRSPNAAQEYVHFVDAITTNKTDFFREPQHLAYLTAHALPALDRQAGSRPAWTAKVWCAGCSSGEEAWTLAMTLSEYGRLRAGFDYSILATDISSRVLAQAEAATYSRESVAPVPPELRKRYLLSSRDPSLRAVRIVPDLRRRVTFERLNFMDRAYGVGRNFGAIFFRNVLIYFDKPTQETVLNKLCDNLQPGGYLFVGHSESLTGLRVPVVQQALSVFRKPE